jgi:hypothetical protein
MFGKEFDLSNLRGIPSKNAVSAKLFFFKPLIRRVRILLAYNPLSDIEAFLAGLRFEKPDPPDQFPRYLLRSYWSIASSEQIVVFNEDLVEPFGASQIQPPPDTCSATTYMKLY